MNFDSQLARIKANIEAKTRNSNAEANADPLYDLVDNTVTKSHALSRAYYRLGLVEKRCMEALISKLHPQRGDNIIQEMELSALEYSKAYKVTDKTAYRDIANAVQGLMHRVITADRPNGKKGKVEFTLMIKSEYRDDEGKISCAFNPLIIPYLIGLRDKFSSYPLKKTVDFSSSYTWRFYELLVSWAQSKQDTGGIFAGWITNQSVIDLRNMLGVPDSYTWGMFQKKVLDVATNELREKAHITVSIKQRKTIRKITHLDIEFIENTQTEITLEGGETPKKKRVRKPKV